MVDVAIEVVQGQARRPIEALWQLYVHDFSELWAGQARAELEPDGRFHLGPLLAYWADPGCIAHLIRAGGHIAGFALVDRTTHSGRPLDRNMAEFFVVRKHRRSGVGRRAAHALFTAYPGQWEAAVARANTGALHFWRCAVGSHPGATHIEEVDMSDRRWNGPVLRFRIGARA